jgi:LCP family protein required for cell wall assembly
VPHPEPVRRRRPARLHRFLIALGIFTVTTATLAAAGTLYARATLNRIDKLSLGGVLTPFDNVGMGPNSVENYLIVGSDSRSGINPDGPPPPGQTTEALPTGRRSDTIMVLRFDPATNSSALLSIPRDLYVEIAGTGHKDKINSAFNQGPDVLIKTVQSQLGIPIHHYVEVDFEGFQRLVDAVGGVSVWFDHPSRDKNTGLRVNGPACVQLNGI